MTITGFTTTDLTFTEVETTCDDGETTAALEGDET